MNSVCNIVGNGPSFNQVPKEVLESLHTFGMNYCGFQPSYYVCIDSDVLTNHVEEIRPLVKYARVAYLSELMVGTSDLYDYVNVKLVAKDLQSFRNEQFFSGFTCAYVALKMSYYIGFDEVHLYGIDFNPEWTHFRPDYPRGASDRRRRMDVMKWHFQLAQNVYTRAGRRVINHSNHSELDAIFARE
jgi:hypothetical protein